jgi:lipopolysaccharide export system protein LptA
MNAKGNIGLSMLLISCGAVFAGASNSFTQDGGDAYLEEGPSAGAGGADGWALSVYLARVGDEAGGEGAKKSEEKEAPRGKNEKKKEEEKPYHVEADVTEGFYAAGDQVLHGIGNVVIVHGETTITCDEAYSYEAQRLATLLGNVKVRDPAQEYTLTAGYAEYHRAEKLAVATKGPRLVLEKERPITITSDIMRMWTDTEYGEAAGNVKIVSEDVDGYGQKLKYFGKEERVELSGKPVVRQEDSRLAGDLITLYLEGDKLRRALVEGSARVLYFSRPEEEAEGKETGERAAPAEGSTAFSEVTPARAEEELVEDWAGERTVVSVPDYEEAEAVGVARAGPEGAGGDEEKETPSGRVEAAGALIEGSFAEGVLEQVDITGDAEGHYWPFDDFGRETGEQVDAAGDRIRIVMNGGEVKKILVEGNAEGIYRPAKTEGRSGVTQTAGDRISVFVSEREVRRIVVFGHAHGSYFTEETPAAEEREVSSG